MDLPKDTRAKSEEQQTYAVCFDNLLQRWDVCRWSSKADRWVRPGGEALQFSPSHWVTPYSSDGEVCEAKHPGMLKVFAGAEPILTAPKSAPLLILLDHNKGAWEIGYWCSWTFNWKQIDGKELIITPTHWAPPTGHCSDTAAKLQQVAPPRHDEISNKRDLRPPLAVPLDDAFRFGDNKPSLAKRSNLGRAALVILSAFAVVGLLTTGYMLGIFYSEVLRPSQTEIVTSVPNRANQDTNSEISSNVARELAALRAELADRVAVKPPGRLEIGSNGIARDTAAEDALRMEAAELAILLEKKEKEWTKTAEAEQQRSIGVARELAAAQAELAKRIAAEASARTEAVELAALLEKKETEWTRTAEAERERSSGVAQDLAAVQQELANRSAAEASARKEAAELATLLDKKETEWTKTFEAERERHNDVARDLAAARAEVADRVTAETSARKEAAERTTLLETKEKEWAKTVETERERFNGVARELAAVRADLAERVTAKASAGKDAAELATLLQKKEAEWAKTAEAERERFNGVARELAAVRADLADRVTAEASARKQAAELATVLAKKETEWAKTVESERERFNGVARELAAVRSDLADRGTAEASGRTTSDLPPNVTTGSANTDRVIVREPSKVAIDRGGSPISKNAADGAKLIARAQSLIKQGDVSGARRFLERAFEGGSPSAAFLLAETYDARILRSLQVYGIKGDAQKALELYGVASEAGIEQAKERILILKGAESP